MIPSTFIPSLAASANCAVQLSLLSGAPGQSTSIRDEPGFVAAVTLGAVPKFAPAWQSMLQPLGYKVSIVSVFCHQTPQVVFNGPGTGRCELADLLVVVDDLTMPGRPSRSAVLVQAKMLKASGSVSVPGQSDQFHLYSTWPYFRFRSGAYLQHPRNFRSSACGCKTLQSGRYGLIDVVSSPPDWHQSAPNATMSATGSPPLGTFIAEMLGQRGGGFGRCCLSPPSDPWSETIDELLRVTAGMKFRHGSFVDSQGNRVPQSRVSFATSLAQSATNFSLDTPVVQCFGDAFPPERPPSEDRPGPEDGGVSAIRIVISRAEESDSRRFDDRERP